MNRFVKRVIPLVACLILMSHMAKAADGYPPVVKIADSSTISSGVVNTRIFAYDPDGVKAVLLVINNGEVIRGGMRAPYQYAWDSSRYAGKRIHMRAVMLDRKGKWASDEMRVTVNPSGPARIPAPGNAVSLHVTDFETGAFQGPSKFHDGIGVLPPMPGLDNSDRWDAAVVNARSAQADVQPFAGNYMAELEVLYDRWNADHTRTTPLPNEAWPGPSPRVNLLRSVNTPGGRFDLGTDEVWIGFATLFPSAAQGNHWYTGDPYWQYEPADRASKHPHQIFQLKGMGGDAPDAAAFQIVWEGNQLYLKQRVGDAKIGTKTTYYAMPGGTPLGKWITWVIRVVRSHDNRGQLQVWRNITGRQDGYQLVLEKLNQPNSYWYGSANKGRGNWHPTFFIYKAGYDDTVGGKKSGISGLTMYYDEIRVAKGTGGFQKVDPWKFK